MAGKLDDRLRECIFVFTSCRMVALHAARLAIERLKRDRLLPENTKQRASKYLNNIIRGALKQLIRSTRGFQTMTTATATIKWLEIMRRIRRAGLPDLQARRAE